jgi:hypothetical protein
MTSEEFTTTTALEGVPGYIVVQHDDRFICIEL